MTGNEPNKRAADREEYRLLEELDRCEALLEEMDELGVTTRDDIEQRMAALHERLDALESS